MDEERIVTGLKKIAALSYQAYLAIKNKEYFKAYFSNRRRGRQPEKSFFREIVSPSMDSFV